MQIAYKEFFEAFGYSEKDTLYLRRFHDKDKSQSPCNMSCELKQIDALATSMKNYNDSGYGIFFVVNGGGQNDGSVKTARAQFIDMDDFSFEEQWRRVNEFPLEPSIILKTKKSLHCYWLLNDGDIKLFREVQERLIQYFESDPAVKNESRVMRLYGFYHQKEEPVLVELVKFEPGIRYTQQQLCDVLPSVRRVKKEDVSKSNDIITEHRHDALISLIGRLKVQRLSDEVVKAAVIAENQTKCCPPLDNVDLEKTIFPAIKRYPNDKTHTPTVCDNGKARPIKPRKQIHYASAKELLSADLPPVEYIVDVIISKGLVILSAKSKIGKSWFALDLAIAVASGADFLGFNTTQGEVLYIDLENSKALTQQRLVRLLNGADAPEGLTITNDYSTMNDTFLEDLTEYLEQHPKVSLVIVDVFQKIKKSKSPNKADYEDIYENFTPLKELAERYAISLILVMHDRKMTDETDPFANVLGSTAIMGASDEMIVIHKKSRNDPDATLSITGRTVQECEYSIRFNKPICKWEMLGDAAEIQAKREKEEFYSNPLVKTIVKLVNTHGGEYSGTATDIIKASEYLRTRIYKSAKQVGKEIGSLENTLNRFASIGYTTINNGNAGKIHKFYRVV